MVQKLDRFQSEEILREVDASDEAQVVDESRARLKLVEEPPTFVEALAAHGIYDRGSLLVIGVNRFVSMSFPPYGKGRAFAGAVLGQPVKNINKGVLEMIADTLALPCVDENRVNQIRIALKAYGIEDRATLKAFGAEAFNKRANQFPPFGGGLSLYRALFGRSVSYLSLDHLDELADALGYEKILMEDYKAALAHKGITDRFSLLRIGPEEFCRIDFGAFRKGRSFVGAVLGRTIPNLTVKDLHEISEKLHLLHANPQRMKQFKSALARHGITSRQSLLRAKLSVVTKLDFPPFGKFKAFVNAVLGESHRSLSHAVLNRLADELGFPEISSHEYRCALSSQGIFDRAGLMLMGPIVFRRTEFPPFGKGSRFAGTILGIVVDNPTSSDLSEIAEKLDLPYISTKRLAEFKSLLFRHNIYDRKTLTATPFSQFQRMDFPPYGGIWSFASAVLDETSSMLGRREVLDRLAIRLRLPEDAGGNEPHIKYTDVYSFKPGGLNPGEEKFDLALERLERSGIYERKDIFRRGVDNFARRNFKGFGLGVDFVSIVLGRKIEKLTEEDLGEFADRLGFLDYGDYFYEVDDENRLFPANGFGPEDTKGNI